MLQEQGEGSDWGTLPDAFPSLRLSQGTISISLLVFHLDPSPHWRFLGVPWWVQPLLSGITLPCVWIPSGDLLSVSHSAGKGVPQFPPFLVASRSSLAKKNQSFHWTFSNPWHGWRHSFLKCGERGDFSQQRDPPSASLSCKFNMKTLKPLLHPTSQF